MIGPVVAAALWAIVASLVFSLVLGGLVAVAVALLRPPAAARQALWSLALAAAGVAPVIILAVMLLRGAAAPAPAASTAELALPAGHARRAAAEHGMQRASARAAAAVATLHVPAPPRVTPIVAGAIAAIWALGALAGLIGLTRSLVRVRGLKLRSSPLDGTLATELPWLTTTSGREIYLRLSYETETPIAVGFRRPVILIPTEMATAAGLTSIEPLIMHEYAHLARYDDWSNLAQRATERIFWFNPLVWILSRRIALEREVAADEAVIARTHDPKNYASTLWRMAQEMRMPEHVVVAPGAMLTRKQISVRIERLLDETPAGTRYAGAAGLALAIVAISGVAGLAVSAPPVVIAQAAPPDSVPRADMPVAVAVTPPTPIPPPVPVQKVQPPPAVPPKPRAADTAWNMPPDVAQLIRRKVADALAKTNVVVADNATGPLSRDLVRNCTGCNFSHRDLHGIDLSGISLVGDDFTHADLAGANFGGTSMQGIDFSQANLRNASFHAAKLTGVDFSRADLDGADLSNASLTGVDLSHASMNRADTTGIRMIGSSLP